MNSELFQDPSRSTFQHVQIRKFEENRSARSRLRQVTHKVSSGGLTSPRPHLSTNSCSFDATTTINASSSSNRSSVSPPASASTSPLAKCGSHRPPFLAGITSTNSDRSSSATMLSASSSTSTTRINGVGAMRNSNTSSRRCCRSSVLANREIVVAMIAEMQEIFSHIYHEHPTDSAMKRLEHQCQILEKCLDDQPPVSPSPPSSTSSSSSSPALEGDLKITHFKRRSNLTFLRMLQQLVSEVGLDDALSSSPGLPILEAFCGKSVTLPAGKPSPTTQTSSPRLRKMPLLPQFETGVNDADICSSSPPSSNTSVAQNSNLRCAVRMFMKRGKDATHDMEINREFVALIEQMTSYSENTCQEVVNQGGLQNLFQACRSEDGESVKHAVFSLANLLHRLGDDYRQEMLRQNTLDWLFTPALHSNEVIQYYTFLTTTIILCNGRIGSILCRNDLVSLIIPFVKCHDPMEFARTNFTDTSPVFAEDWLARLAPALASDTHFEAQTFAAFHFAIAACLRNDFLQSLGKDLQRSMESSLEKLSELKREPACKLASQTLKTIGLSVPKALSLQVFTWPTEDVVCWIKREGFDQVAEKAKEVEVDGEILLALTDEDLKEGLGLNNSISRFRFLRQLSRLKAITDYTPMDPTGVAEFLSSAAAVLPRDERVFRRLSWTPQSTGNRFTTACGTGATAASTDIAAGLTISSASLRQYTYSLLRHGLTRDRLVELTDSDLKETCQISNSIHRRMMMAAFRDASQGISGSARSEERRIDFFISYRRSNGTHLASLIKTHLQLRKFSVFLDIERLKGGRFDHNLLDSIRRADNFILVLTEGALDRCSADGSDWVRREINCALENKCHIIPLTDRFVWKEAENLPEDIRPIKNYNAVQWAPEFEEGCIERIIQFRTASLTLDQIGHS